MVNPPIDTDARTDLVRRTDRRDAYHSQTRARHAWSEEQWPAQIGASSGRRSTTSGLPEALLVSQNEAPYTRSTFQAYRSSVDPSDPSTYCRFSLEHQSSLHDHTTGECPHVARGDTVKLEAIRKANYPAYHNLLKERYRTGRRTSGGQQSRESARKDDTHVNHLVAENKRGAAKRKPCTSLFSCSAAVR